MVTAGLFKPKNRKDALRLNENESIFKVILLYWGDACAPNFGPPSFIRNILQADMEPMIAKFPNINIDPNNLEHQVAVAHQMFLKDAPGSTEETMNGCLN